MEKSLVLATKIGQFRVPQPHLAGLVRKFVT